MACLTMNEMTTSLRSVRLGSPLPNPLSRALSALHRGSKTGGFKRLLEDDSAESHDHQHEEGPRKRRALSHDSAIATSASNDESVSLLLERNASLLKRLLACQICGLVTKENILCCQSQHVMCLKHFKQMIGTPAMTKACPQCKGDLCEHAAASVGSSSVLLMLLEQLPVEVCKRCKQLLPMGACKGHAAKCNPSSSTPVQHEEGGFACRGSSPTRITPKGTGEATAEDDNSAGSMAGYLATLRASTNCTTRLEGRKCNKASCCGLVSHFRSHIKSCDGSRSQSGSASPCGICVRIKVLAKKHAGDCKNACLAVPCSVPYCNQLNGRTRLASTHSLQQKHEPTEAIAEA